MAIPDHRRRKVSRPGLRAGNAGRPGDSPRGGRRRRPPPERVQVEPRRTEPVRLPRVRGVPGDGLRGWDEQTTPIPASMKVRRAYLIRVYIEPRAGVRGEGFTRPFVSKSFRPQAGKVKAGSVVPTPGRADSPSM